MLILLNLILGISPWPCRNSTRTSVMQANDVAYYTTEGRRTFIQALVKHFLFITFFKIVRSSIFGSWCAKLDNYIISVNKCSFLFLVFYTFASGWCVGECNDQGEKSVLYLSQQRKGVVLHPLPSGRCIN